MTSPGFSVLHRVFFSCRSQIEGITYLSTSEYSSVTFTFSLLHSLLHFTCIASALVVAEPYFLGSASDILSIGVMLSGPRLESQKATEQAFGFTHSTVHSGAMQGRVPLLYGIGYIPICTLKGQLREMFFSLIASYPG